MSISSVDLIFSSLVLLSPILSSVASHIAIASSDGPSIEQPSPKVPSLIPFLVAQISSQSTWQASLILAKETSSLLSVMQNNVEPSLIEHGQSAGGSPGWKRPFVETASADRRALEKTIQEMVEFPELDESIGDVIITFLGPMRDRYLEREVGWLSYASMIRRSFPFCIPGS
jgi:hypothetical protein